MVAQSHAAGIRLLELNSDVGPAAHLEAATAPTPGTSMRSGMEDEVPSCCSSRCWTALWLIAILNTMVTIFSALVLPDIGTRYFGGGKDPCIGAGRGTPACDAAISKFASVAAMFGVVGAVISLATGPLLGSVVGVVGAKPIIVLSMVLSLTNGVALMLVTWAGASIYYVFGAGVLTSIVSGNVSFNMWLVEYTRPSGRPVVFARLAAASTIEGIIAPLATKFVDRDTAPVFVMLFMLAGLAIAICFLPKRRSAAATQEGMSRAVKGTLTLVRIRRVASYFLRGSNSLILLVNAIGGTVTAGMASIYFFFLKEKFGMGMQDFGLVFGVLSLSHAVCQLFLVKPLKRLLGLRGTILLSFTCAATITCLGYILVSSVRFVYIILIVGGLNVIGGPIVAAMVTNMVEPHVPAEDLAVTVGMVQSCGAFAGLFGPWLFRAVFSYFLQPGRHSTEMVWVLALLLNLAGIALTLCLPMRAFDTGSPAECSQLSTAS